MAKTKQATSWQQSSRFFRACSFLMLKMLFVFPKKAKVRSQKGRTFNHRLGFQPFAVISGWLEQFQFNVAASRELFGNQFFPTKPTKSLGEKGPFGGQSKPAGTEELRQLHQGCAVSSQSKRAISTEMLAFPKFFFGFPVGFLWVFL